MVQSHSSQLKSQIIKAGAGTGKTTFLIQEVFKKSNDGDQKVRLMVCTFTKKATQELKEKLLTKALEINSMNFLKYVHSPSLHVSTIHGILNIFLKEYGLKYGLNFDFQILSDTDEDRILQEIARECLYRKEHIDLLKNLSFQHIKHILKFYAKYKTIFPDLQYPNKKDFSDFNNSADEEILKKHPEAFNPDFFLPYFKKMNNLSEEFYHEFLKKKKQLNALTYDDLELFSLDLIRQNPKIAQSFSGEWDYWFIDEYQDTSFIQEQIFKHFTQFKNVFCVGDPQQSIYSFRDADPEVFKRRVEDPKMEKRNLKTNYRSESFLIDFFNDFFRQEEKNFLPLVSEKQKEETPQPSSILKYDSHSPKECFKKIAYQIEDIHRTGVDYKDICVLSRKNNFLFDLSLYLKSQNIPSQIQSNKQSLRKRIILDSLFALRFLINPHDKENTLALLRTPYFFVSDQELSNFCKNYHALFDEEDTEELQVKSGNYVSFWNHIKDSKKYAIKRLNYYLKIKAELGLIVTFEHILFESGFMDLTVFQDPSGLEESYLWKLIYLVRENGRSDEHSLLDLIYSIIEEGEDSLDEETHGKEVVSFLSMDAVQLMTIHKSKGLEFDHVLIFDLSQKRPTTSKDVVLNSKTKKMFFSVPPQENIFKKKIKCYGHIDMDKISEQKQEEELKRLMYVAMTRAKKTVSFIMPQEGTIRNIFYPFRNYFNNIDSKQWIQVKEGIGEMTASKQTSLPPDVLLKPLGQGENHLPIKLAKDFVEETSPHSPPSFVLQKFENIFFKSYLGNQIHHFLQLLTKHPLPLLKEVISQMNFKKEEKERIIRCLDYVKQLKEPDLSHFIEKGYAEWPFQLKTSKALLKGRIDLWGQIGNEIWIFDYKSSFSEKSEELFKQLSFYAYVLDQIHRPKKIVMCGVYPLEEKINQKIYSEEHKKQILLWLEAVKNS